MPSTRPVSPIPMHAAFSAQRPSRVIRSFSTSRWLSARRSVITAVATGRRTPSGVMVRSTPRRVQALTSTVS